MPREIIDLPEQVEYLSVLNEDGELDEELEPDLSDDFLLQIHRALLFNRRFDERMLNLQRQGRIGTFAPVKGQEAAEVAAAAVLREEDWLVQSYRDQAAAIWRGQPPESYLLAYGGYYQGNNPDVEVRNLPVSVPVGSQILHAVGLSYGSKYRQKEEVVLVFFGDGATSEGDFHEGLNFAGVFQTPVIFLCQNNQWAISVPRSRQSRAKTLAQKALAYGVPGLQVDGNDVLAVYAAAKEAAERARAGDGPTLIEALTYRLSLHTTADDPTRYRKDEEVEEWEKRDPIPRFQNYLKDKGILSDDELESLQEEIEQDIEAAVEKAEQQMEALDDEALSMFDHVYAEMPPYLQEQRDSLAAELEAK